MSDPKAALTAAAMTVVIFVTMGLVRWAQNAYHKRKASKETYYETC